MAEELPQGLERRYLKPTVAHVIDTVLWLHSGSPALCGASPAWWDSHGWRGTGNQEEYETAARLRLCRRCEVRLAARKATLDTHAERHPRPDRTS